jgi:soluble lytic murein transglycosylase-like protein
LITKFECEILSASVKYSIPNQWIKAIIAQESNWDQYAVRLEPSYQYLYEAEVFAKKLGITLSTEMTCQKMSWGLGQIMLALAREQGHEGHAGELFEPKVNIEHIAIRLAHLRTLSPIVDDIIAMYNSGPGGRHKANGVYKNQAYVDSVKNHLKTYTA